MSPFFFYHLIVFGHLLQLSTLLSLLKLQETKINKINHKLTTTQDKIYLNGTQNHQCMEKNSKVVIRNCYIYNSNLYLNIV